MAEICVALDGTPIPEAVGRWFDERSVHWVPWSTGDGDARVLVVGGFARVGAAEVAAMRRLELVVRTGAGYEHVDVSLLERQGIRLVAPRLVDDPSVPEFVIGSVITVLRRLVQADGAARSGAWEFREIFQQL